MNSEIQETGDWAADNKTGREAAMTCVRQIRDPNHFSSVMRQIVSRGRFGAIEVGFFTAIGVMLVVGVTVASAPASRRSPRQQVETINTKKGRQPQSHRPFPRPADTLTISS